MFVLVFGVIGFGSWHPAWSADETASVMVVRRSWSGVLHTFRYDSALEPYYLFLKVWSWPSTSHMWLRLPSVLAMSGAVCCVWLLAQRLYGPRVGLAALALMVVCPAISQVGQDARPYALALLFVVLAVSNWQTGLSALGLRQRLRPVVWLVLAGAAHPYALTIVPVLLLAAAMGPRRVRRKNVRRTVVQCAGAVLVLSPFLFFVLIHAQGQPNPASISLSGLAITEGRVPVGLLSTPLAIPVAAAVLGLGVAGLVLDGRRHDPRGGAAPLLALWTAIPPASLCLFQALTGSPGVVTRYWLFSLPAISIAGAVAVERLRLRTGALAVAGIVVLAGIAVPSQLAARGANGHLGQGWSEFPEVVALPGVRSAAVLTASWNYHGLVGNDASIVSRLPLVRDPNPSGRIVPTLDGPGTPQFDELLARKRMVIVLTTVRSSSRALPTLRTFDGFAPELSAFRVPAAECNYFGQGLGVFTTQAAALSGRDAAQLVTSIEAVAPGGIECAESGTDR